MNPLTSAAILFGLVAFLAFFAYVVRLEREGRREVVLGMLLAILLADSLLYPSQTTTPVGLFRPTAGGFSFRLVEVFVVTALAARLLVHGLPKRVKPVGVVWFMFFLWYLTSAAAGWMLGNPTDDILFQGKAIVYAGGTLLLALGTPAERLVRREALGKWVVAVGALAAVMVVVSLSPLALGVRLPGLRIDDLGELGADAASLLAALATVVLLVEGCRRHLRGVVALAGVPMVLAVFIATQRAAILGVAVTALVISVAAVGVTWKRRLEVKLTQVLLGLVVIAVIGLVASFVGASQGVVAPVGEIYEDTFESTAKQQSADTRGLLYAEGKRLWWERPIFGWGLGKQFEIFKAGSPNEDWVSGGFHNLGWDLLVRSGTIGLALFVVAIYRTLRDGRRVWRSHYDNKVAALALACSAVTCGLLAKGMFESIFEKYRLATLLGLLLGVIISATASMESSKKTDQESWQPRESMAWS